jgi:hypothetical protein
MYFLSRAIYCGVHILLRRNIKDNLSFCVKLGLTCAHRSYTYMSDNFCTFHAVTTQKCYLKFIVIIICITHYHGHICVQKTRFEKCAIAARFGERSLCYAEHTGVLLNIDILVVKYEGKWQVGWPNSERENGINP